MQRYRVVRDSPPVWYCWRNAWGTNLGTFDLTGQHIAITGASSGFGRHFGLILAAAGASVSLGARRTQLLDDLVGEIEANGGKANAVHLDVTQSESIERFFDAAETSFGPVNVLINNAGVEAGAKTYTMIDEADWDYVIDTNLKSAWLASKRFTERVQANELSSGNIIMVSSITDTRTIKGQFPYAVSKGGLTRMTEVMALEAARYNIRGERAGARLHPDGRQSHPAGKRSRTGFYERYTHAQVRRVRRSGRSAAAVGLGRLPVHDGISRRGGWRAHLCLSMNPA